MLCVSCHKIADGHNIFSQGDERRIKYLSYTIKQIQKSNHPLLTKDKKFLKSIKKDFDLAIEMLH